MTAIAPAVGPSASRCGIDTVAIERIERLLATTPRDDLTRIFSARELGDSGDGPGQAASLAARFAAKEACAKLFPRELATGQIVPEDFSVERDGHGAPQVVCSPRAQALLARHRLSGISISLTHDRLSASAVALALPGVTEVSLAGRLIYRFLPIRRKVILENLRRVFGPTAPEAEIVRLAQAHYAHLWRLLLEMIRFRWMSEARKRAMIRVENVEALHREFEKGRGALVLTGHFGTGKSRLSPGCARTGTSTAGFISCAGRSSRRGSTRGLLGAFVAKASASSASAGRSIASSA